MFLDSLFLDLTYHIQYTGARYAAAAHQIKANKTNWMTTTSKLCQNSTKQLSFTKMHTLTKIHNRQTLKAPRTQAAQVGLETTVNTANPAAPST